MAKNFDFSRLVPERDTFSDDEGNVYEFRSRLDFGAEDAAKAEGCTKQLAAAQARMRKNTKDADAIRKFEEASRRFFSLILPDLPDDKMSTMSLGQIGMVIEWWNERQEELKAKAEAEDLGEFEADQLD